MCLPIFVNQSCCWSLLLLDGCQQKSEQRQTCVVLCCPLNHCCRHFLSRDVPVTTCSCLYCGVTIYFCHTVTTCPVCLQTPGDRNVERAEGQSEECGDIATATQATAAEPTSFAAAFPFQRNPSR